MHQKRKTEHDQSTAIQFFQKTSVIEKKMSDKKDTSISISYPGTMF